MKRIIGIATFAVMLSAFATAATAKPPVAQYEAAADINGAGWLTAPAENGRYYVVYTGAKGMSRQQVAQFALLRAAEFTDESGLEWFAVIETKSQKVQLVPKSDDLKSRSGGFMGGPGGSSTNSGAAGASTSPRGTSDSSTAGGASTGGFGGGAPPTAVMERWTPPSVPQTVFVIQMGKGEDAAFPGLKKAPEIFSAKTTAAEIRAKMTP